MKSNSPSSLSSASSENVSAITFSYISENAVLLEWPEKICPIQHQHIMYCQAQVINFLSGKVIDCIASYAGLLIYYKFELVPHYELNTFLHNLVQAPYSPDDTAQTKNTKNTKNRIEIPVYYGEDAGWDITEVAQLTQLSINEVIKLHTQTHYRAYALGFTPGFCYLGELPDQLQLPRKASPRISVPKGAVAIAEKQTAVYPNASPGGWHIIGQTPLDMYSVNIKTKSQPFNSTINVGQSVKFIAITKAEFVSLGGQLVQDKN